MTGKKLFSGVNVNRIARTESSMTATRDGEWKTKMTNQNTTSHFCYSHSCSQRQQRVKQTYEISIFFSLSLFRCQLPSIYCIDTCVCLTGSNPHAINSNTNKSINMQEVFSISLCHFLACFLYFVRWTRRARENWTEIHILAYQTSKIVMFLPILITCNTNFVSKTTIPPFLNHDANFSRVAS